MMMITLDSDIQLVSCVWHFKKGYQLFQASRKWLKLALGSLGLQFSLLASINHWPNKTNKKRVMVLGKNLGSHTRYALSQRYTITAVTILIYFLDVCLCCKLYFYCTPQTHSYYTGAIHYKQNIQIKHKRPTSYLKTFISCAVF